jgi:5-methylcytosine-specific restriction endonuclease McrA
MTTLPTGEQTHPGVLPQRQAMESAGADNSGSRDETACGHSASQLSAGGKHGRGETRLGSTRRTERHAESAAPSAETAATRSGNAPHATSDRTVAPTRHASHPGAPHVFVLDKGGRPLMPCHPARARELLSKGRAVVTRQSPFVIRLKDRTRDESSVQDLQIRIDPGSRATGIALTVENREDTKTAEPITVRRGLMAFELRHRGSQISARLKQRADYRRRRRNKNCRYRAPRYANRARPNGWLPPSLVHRANTTVSLVSRLIRWCPVSEIHVERAAFDVHALSAGQPLHGAEYQHGTLHGVEIRAYLLSKWDHSCAYCSARDVPLNIDHVHPRAHGGSNRISNLLIACVPCNQAKGDQRIDDFLSGRPALLVRIRRQLKTPLRDAAAMNATRNRLMTDLSLTGLPVLGWSGARTKWNRGALDLPKSHTFDALCVGEINHEAGHSVVRHPFQIMTVTATGRGTYARTRPDRFGFPRLRLPRTKLQHGFQTGDFVRATLRSGRYEGTHTGRVAVRASGRFNIKKGDALVQGVHHRHIQLLQRADGYAYAIAGETRSRP